MRRTPTASATGAVGPGSATAAAVVAAVLLLGGCSLGGPREGLFVLPETPVVDCQEHQDVAPSDAYAGDESSDTVAMLDLLQYWAENGDKPYCDGEPAGEADLLWAETVGRLRGEAPPG